MPVEYIAWFRMNVDDLSPREYWATAIEDMGLATAIQEAQRRGESRAHKEAQEERDEIARKARVKAEHEKKSKEMHKELRGRI